MKMKIMKMLRLYLAVFAFYTLASPSICLAEIGRDTSFLGLAADPSYEADPLLSPLFNIFPRMSYMRFESQEERMSVLTPGGRVYCSGWISRDYRLSDGWLAYQSNPPYYYHPANYHLSLNGGMYLLRLNGVENHPTEVRHGWRVLSVNSDPFELKAQHYWAYNDQYDQGTFYDLITRTYLITADLTQTWLEDNYPRHWEWYGNPEYITYAYHSPLVDATIPQPAMDSSTNNTGFITNLTDEPFNMGDNINTWFESKTITGAVSGETLERNESSTLSAYEYKATCDMSGASGLVNDQGDIIGFGSGTLVWTITDWEGDITIFTQPIKVAGVPDIHIYFPGTSFPYDNRWMSIDPSADINRQGGLDVQASSTIDGNYDLSTFINGSKLQTDEVTRANTDTDPVTNNAIPGWEIADSTITGIPATSQAFLLNDATSISGMSAEKRMYFDSTKPTITEVETTDNWATITTDATDEASGIGGSGDYDTGDVFFKFVAKGAPAPTTPVGNDTGWTSIDDYATTFATLTAGGEYDLYVYAKDNATNRSEAIKANKDGPIIIAGGAATITIEKTVVGTKGDANDIFLIRLSENSNLLTSVALKEGDTSSELILDMGSATSKDIKVSEIIPMDYDDALVTVKVTNQSGSSATVSGDTVTIHPGDNVTIVVENTFAPTGYFKGKDFVKNLFK